MTGHHFVGFLSARLIAHLLIFSAFKPGVLKRCIFIHGRVDQLQYPCSGYWLRTVIEYIISGNQHGQQRPSNFATRASACLRREGFWQQKNPLPENRKFSPKETSKLPSLPSTGLSAACEWRVSKIRSPTYNRFSKKIAHFIKHVGNMIWCFPTLGGEDLIQFIKSYNILELVTFVMFECRIWAWQIKQSEGKIGS